MCEIVPIKPTGNIGGKPSGEKSPILSSDTAAKQRQIELENESAEILANNGYKVKQNPGELPNGKNPDFEIEGNVFDNLAPTSNNIDQVRKGISNKIRSGQTERIVLNLDDSIFDSSDIADLISRKPKEGLLELIVIKGGEITKIL